MKYRRDDYAPPSQFEVIKAGVYRAEIINTQWKRNAAGSGKYIEIQYEILEREYAGRYLWDRLNLEHPNATAVKISCQNMTGIQLALGMDVDFDTDNDEQMMRVCDKLLHKRLILNVGVGKRKDTGADENRILAYEEGGVQAPSRRDADARPAAVEDEDDLPF